MLKRRVRLGSRHGFGPVRGGQFPPMIQRHAACCVNYEDEEGGSVNETVARVGHPIEGVFMKCWRCQQTRRLEYDGTGGLRCPDCSETLIPLEDPVPL